MMIDENTKTGETEEKVEETQEGWWKGPIRYILAIFLLLLLVLWYFPAQSVKVDPEPRNMPLITEVIPPNLAAIQPDFIPASRHDYLMYVSPADHEVKYTADRIAALSCDGNRICHAKAIFYFVRDNFQYVSDPTAFDYVKTARQSLLSGGGDCDDAAVLAANLLQAVGIQTRFVFIPGHVYIQAYLPEAARKYKSEDKNYVNLDLTCRSCDFGELPYADTTDEKTIVG